MRHDQLIVFVFELPSVFQTNIRDGDDPLGF
jgi:hypothetical protein